MLYPVCRVHNGHKQLCHSHGIACAQQSFCAHRLTLMQQQPILFDPQSNSLRWTLSILSMPHDSACLMTDVRRFCFVKSKPQVCYAILPWLKFNAAASRDCQAHQLVQEGSEPIDLGGQPLACMHEPHHEPDSILVTIIESNLSCQSAPTGDMQESLT